MKREIRDDDELVDIRSTGIAMAAIASISMLSSCSPSLVSTNPALIRAESSTVTQLKDLGVMEDEGSVLQKEESHPGDRSSTAVAQSDEELTYTGKRNNNNNVVQNRSDLYRNPGGCGKKGSAMSRVRPPGSDAKNNFADPPRLAMADRNESSGTSGVVEGEKMAGNKKANSALYGLRRNPKRSRKFFNQASAAPPKKPNSIFSEKARACTECGKEFSSWKALFGHMRCHPEREWRGILPPQGVRHERDQHHLQQQRAQVQATHGKKLEESGSELEDRMVSYKLPDDDSDTESIETAYLNGIHQNPREAPEKRSKPNQKPGPEAPAEEMEKEAAARITTTPTEIMEQRDMAHCLVMLSSAGRTENESAFSDNRDDNEPAESTESAKLQWQVAMSPANHQSQSRPPNDGDEDNAMRFECGTCKKVFRSHQALGGHRASHKRVKGCFAITNENQPDDAPVPAPHELVVPKSENYNHNQRSDAYREINPADHEDHGAKKNRGAGNHQCSICFRVFSTGQALGGHKRCHWGSGESGNKDPIPSEHHRQQNTNNIHQAQQQRPPSKSMKADLDLNLPAPADDEAADQSRHAASARADELELRLGNGSDAKRAAQFPFLPRS